MSKERRNCEAPGCPGRTSGRFCTDCVSAKRDDESPWDLGEGYWRTRKGVKVEWVPKFVPDPGAVLKDGHVRCAACPATFVPTRPYHAYCSLGCRKRAGWARRSAKANQQRREERALERQRRMILKQELSAPCSTCDAPAGQGCKSPSGTSQAPHVARLAAAGLRPRCECGNQLPPSRKKWCDACKAVARRDARRAATERYRSKNKKSGRVSSRGACGTCWRVLHVLNNGTVRLHRGDDKQACPGSHRPAAAEHQVAA